MITATPAADTTTTRRTRRAAGAGTARRRWAARLLGVLVAAAVAVGLAVPAQAATSGPGRVEAQVYCTAGSIVVAPGVSVQNGYFNGQYISYQYHLTNNRGYRGTSGWSSAIFVPYITTSWGAQTAYGMGFLPQARIPAVSGASWTVSVRVAYYDTRTGAYTYSGWYAPSMVSTYVPTYKYTAPHASCLT